MSSKVDEEKFYITALDAAKAAGRLVKDAFSLPTRIVETKASDIDLVTETDRAVEELLVHTLSTSFPEHKFIGEESAAAGKKYEFTDAPTWIIDPIDGTTNFVHRIPMVAICIGLTINKVLRLGIVYNPITDELYTAQAGKGAFKNGFPIRVSNTKTLDKSVVTTSLGVHNIPALGSDWLDTALENQKRVVQKGIRGSRAFGSAALNMVYTAQGSIDAYVEYGLHSWDMAAAAIILKEAGGYLMDPNGNEFDVMSRKVLCAANEELAKELSSILIHAEFDREC